MVIRSQLVHYALPHPPVKSDAVRQDDLVRVVGLTVLCTVPYLESTCRVAEHL